MAGDRSVGIGKPLSHQVWRKRIRFATALTILLPFLVLPGGLPASAASLKIFPAPPSASIAPNAQGLPVLRVLAYAAFDPAADVARVDNLTIVGPSGVAVGPKDSGRGCGCTFMQFEWNDLLVATPGTYTITAHWYADLGNPLSGFTLPSPSISIYVPPPPNQRFSTNTKRTFRALAAATKSFGFALTWCTLMVPPAGAILGWPGLIALGIGIGFDIALAVDPPDPNYTVIAEPEPPSVPAVNPQPGVSPEAAVALNAYLAEGVRTVGLMRAWITSVERAWGAKDAGSEAWEARQMAAAGRRAASLAQSLERSMPLLLNASAALKESGLSTPLLDLDEVRRVQGSIARDGIPEPLLSQLKQFGFTADEIEAIRYGLLSADPKALQGPASDLVTSIDPGLVHDLGQVVAELRAFAERAGADPLNTKSGGIPIGSLQEQNCIAHAIDGCIEGRGLRGTKFLALSADGRSAYATARDSDAVAILSRDAETGALVQADGPTACISDNGPGHDPSCEMGVGLDGPAGVVVSPDGNSVYVAAPRSNALATFRRDQDTGLLQQLDCISTAGPSHDADCREGSGLDGANFVAISPDGLNVYVASWDSALALFSRDVTTGRLTQLGCIVDKGRTMPECSSGTGMKGAFSVTVSPDGRNVYVAAPDSSAVAAFSRDSRTGLLQEVGCISGDNSYRQDPNCTAGFGIQYAQFVTVSPDNRYVYASATDSHTIAILSRTHPDGSLSQRSGLAGCIRDRGYSGKTPCLSAIGLALPVGSVFSSDSRYFYLAAFGYGSITSFGRDASTGVLWQVGGCTAHGDPRCKEGRALDGAGFITLSPDGRHAYVSSMRSGSVTWFERKKEPLSSPPPSGPWPVLRIGSRGEDVRTVQYLLREHDQQLEVDGILGRHTAGSIRAFQASHPPLAVDGIVGGMTWPRLLVGIQRGDRGDGVRAAQSQLLAQTFNDPAREKLVVDGIFGPITEAAVRAFQEWAAGGALPIRVNGRVDLTTWKALVLHVES